MDIAQAKPILQSLADGVDPITGEAFPEQSPYQRPQTIRALYLALKVLEASLENRSEDRPLPENAGMAWTSQEEKQLLDKFNSGFSINQISLELKRTEVSIETRLVRLGRITDKGKAARYATENPP